MKAWHLSALALAVGLALPHPALHAQEASLVVAKLQTQATASREANAAVVVRNTQRTGRDYIVATAALAGLEVYDLSGKRVGSAPAGEVAAVDVAYGIALGKRMATVLAAIDTTTNSLRLFEMDQARLSEIGARPLPLGFAAEGVCLYRNPLDSALYAFVVGDGGEIDQQILFATAEGKLDARQVRRVNVPSPLKQCVAGDGHVYASEEGVGIWRIKADPEADVSATHGRCTAPWAPAGRERRPGALRRRRRQPLADCLGYVSGPVERVRPRQRACLSRQLQGRRAQVRQRHRRARSAVCQRRATGQGVSRAASC